MTEILSLESSNVRISWKFGDRDANKLSIIAASSLNMNTHFESKKKPTNIFRNRQ